MPSAANLHQLRLLARADQSADRAETAIGRTWGELLRAIRAGGSWPAVFDAARQVLHTLSAAATDVGHDLAALHRDAATWTAEHLVATLPRRVCLALLRRRGLLEDVANETQLLAGSLLPPLDPFSIRRVVYGSGWVQSFQRLTRLAAPDVLASRIAGLVQQGQTVQQIARAIRPVVQGVQVSARRVARTAGLWIAHEAERDVYRGLENDLIIGYQVNAVLDQATRPEHRKRDGQRFYFRPQAGQRPMNECPHPPREADGSLAFNCRCFLTPILSV